MTVLVRMGYILIVVLLCARQLLPAKSVCRQVQVHSNNPLLAQNGHSMIVHGQA